MALEDDFQDKTEDPTEERVKEFREKGDVTQSRELVSVFALLGSLIFFYMLGKDFFENIQRIMIYMFQSANNVDLALSNLPFMLNNIFSILATMFMPMFMIIISLILLSGLGQTNFNFSFNKISPSFDKLNPLSGMKRFISSHSLNELIKSIIKIIVVGWVAYSVISDEFIKMPLLSNVSIGSIWSYWSDIISTIFIRVLMLMLVVSLADYGYNWFSMRKKMMMSKQGIKDEFKNKEGDPLIKRRIREVQRQVSSRRMIQAMDKATALITNPTHFAVAIMYEKGMRAPVVIAKGQDFLALKLREVAKEKNVPIVENKPLARTLYKMLKIGQEIPESLYKAVSEVIAYVYRLKGKQRKG